MKPAYIEMKARDAEGNVIGTLGVSGTANDEGTEVLIGAGYLPGIGSAPLEDITITISNPPLIIAPASVTQEVIDEQGTQKISFTA